ncbi:MAG: YciE/YciF ferroxidase family protein [Chitinophagaceae bacterium]
MQTGTNKLNSALQDFFVTCLKEMYWSEDNMRHALATMTHEATTNELKNAFLRHEEQTEMHAKILENVFALLGLSPEPEPSVGLQGLFDEGWQAIDETENGTAQRDVALIIAAQKVEHYEIATYGSLISLAKTLGHQEIVELLKPVLEEEKETDEILTSIAESEINAKASEEPAVQPAADIL